MNVCYKSSKTLESQTEETSFQIMRLLSVLNAFTISPEEYYPKHYKANDAKGFQKPLS